MRTLIAALLSLGFSLSAQADVYQYGGLGLFNNGLFANYQVGNKYGNLEFRVGQFRDVGPGWLFNMSARRYIEQDANSDGFYVGVYLGQIETTPVGGKQYERFGAGGEMGFQWVTPYTKTEFFGGLGVARPVSFGGDTVKASPEFLVGLSIALDLGAK